MESSGAVAPFFALFAFFPIILLGGVVAIVIYFIVQQNKKERKRAEYLHHFATSRGWSYTHDAIALKPQFGLAPPFKGNSSGKYKSALGFYAAGRPTYSFDFEYTVQSGKNSTTYYNHVVALEMPYALPLLEIRPEGATRAIAEFFGMGDIQFESDIFNRAWNVTSSNTSFAHEVVSPQMMDWLMQPELSGANFVIDRGMLYTTIAERQDARRIDGMVWYLNEFYSRIPDFVWDKARGGAL